MSDKHVRMEHHVTGIDQAVNAVDLLAGETGLSRGRIKAAMTRGAVWLGKGGKTQRLRRARHLVKPGQSLHLYYDSALLQHEPPPPVLLADLGRYSVWNKPAGMLSQGSQWGDHCALLRWVALHLQPRRETFLVHRLDREANGLMLVAHDRQAAAALSALFQRRLMDKRYRVEVEGHFSDNREPVTVRMALDGRPATSHFCLVKSLPGQNRSRLDVRIESGRKHQIRRHAASLGHPVVGDRLYGGGRAGDELQLMACYLSFDCPICRKRQLFTL